MSPRGSRGNPEGSDDAITATPKPRRPGRARRSGAPESVSPDESRRAIRAAPNCVQPTLSANDHPSWFLSPGGLGVHHHPVSISWPPGVLPPVTDTPRFSRRTPLHADDARPAFRVSPSMPVLFHSGPAHSRDVD